MPLGVYSKYMQEVQKQLDKYGEVTIRVGMNRKTAPIRKRIYLAAERLGVRVYTRLKTDDDGNEIIVGKVIKGPPGSWKNRQGDRWE